MLRKSRRQSSSKKQIILTIISFLPSTLPAITNDSVKELNQRLVNVEQAYKNAVNPSANLGYGPFIQGDVLFWQARETGLAYAIKAMGPIDLLPTRFDIKEPDFEWDFGFRLGVGYDMQRDGWDIGATWTRFLTDAKDGGMLTSDKFFLPIWANPDFTVLNFHITEAKAHWKLHFNSIDVGLGRAFYISKSFCLRPFMGPSFVWIDQHYHIEYEEVSFLGIQPVEKDHVTISNDFYGIGAQLGCDVHFFLGRAWSIWAKATGNIYAGEFEIRRKEVFNLFDEEKYKIKQHFHAGRAATCISMGFNWEHAMAKNRFIRARLSYDIQFYFKQNQMLRVIAEFMNPSETFIADQGDLNLHGGSFSIMLGF